MARKKKIKEDNTMVFISGKTFCFRSHQYGTQTKYSLDFGSGRRMWMSEEELSDLLTSLDEFGQRVREFFEKGSNITAKWNIEFQTKEKFNEN